MAQDDIGEVLSALGLNLPDSEIDKLISDIIRLNALGVKAERGRDSVSFYCLPRCCFLGDICFREPTLGHEIWYDSVSRFFDAEDEVTDVTLKAYMMSRDYNDLPDPANIPEVKYQVDKFVRNDLKPFTVRQIIQALCYCANGADANTVEDVYKGEQNNDEILNRDDVSIALGVIREGQALGLGVSLADAKTMTRSAFQEVIFRAYEAKQIPVSESIKKECVGDYLKTLDEIKSRFERNG